MSHLLCGSFSDEEVDPHWCICDKLKACNLTPYNVYLDGITLFLENRRTFKTTKYKLFSTFLQQFECFYIRLFSRLALMCEMDNATVTTCKVARVNSAIEAIDTRNVNKNNLLSKDIIAINGPHVHWYCYRLICMLFIWSIYKSFNSCQLHRIRYFLPLQSYKRSIKY